MSTTRSFQEEPRLPSTLLQSLFLISLALLASVSLVIWGVQKDYLVRVIQLLVGLYGLVALARWLAGGRWRPALFLVAQGPFQGILTGYFGILANMLTWVPIIVFLSRFPKHELRNVLQGTRIQRLTLLFVATLSFSVVLSFQYGFQIRQVVGYAQKVTLFMLLGVFSHMLRRSDLIRKVSFVLVISIGLLYLIAIADFYWGISFLPRHTIWGEQGLLATLSTRDLEFSHNYRLRGGGMTVNRLGFWAILPFFCTVGLLHDLRGAADKRLMRLIAYASLAILSFGLVANMSRGALVGMTVAAIVLLIGLTRHKLIQPRFVFGLMVILALAVVLFANLVTIELITYRFSSEGMASIRDRLERWAYGFELFLRNPLLGAGAGAYKGMYTSGRFAIGGGIEAHSFLMELLAERGLIATVPFLLLLGSTYFTLLKLGLRDQDMVLWQTVYLAGFTGMLVHSLVSTYQYERVFWLCIALAAAIESQISSTKVDPLESPRLVH